jgi:radical SAM protein with 4Fe4S-binding SPASM domain
VRFLSDVLLQARDDGKATTADRVTPEQLHRYFQTRVDRADAAELEAQGRQLLNKPALEEMERRAGCGAGRSFASVQPNGDVLACVQLPTMKMGNLREKRFTELWLDSPPVRALRALTVQRFAECRGCSYRHVCAKCPALSLTDGGSIDGHSRQICERTKAYWGAIEARLEGTALARPLSERQVGPFEVDRATLATTAPAPQVVTPALGDVLPSSLACSSGGAAPRRHALRVVGG